MSAADYMTSAGLVLISVGFGLAWPPLGVIVAGAGLLTLGIGWERSQ